MAGEAEAIKAGADAAKNIITTEPVIGSLLVLALIAIALLLLYIRSIHNNHGLVLSKVQEGRLADLRDVMRAMADCTAVLSKFTETLPGLGQTLTAVGTVVHDVSTKQDVAVTSIREYLNRIESDISSLSEKVDRNLPRGR